MGLARVIVPLALNLAITGAVAARPGARAATGIDPSRLGVLLLRPIDATVDSAQLGPLRRKIIRLRQQYEFIRRHFTVMGEDMAEQAAALPPRIDLSGPTGRSAEALDELARRVGADWVVSIRVREIKTDSLEGATFGVHSTIVVQVRDARRRDWMANALYVGHLREAGAPGRLFIESLDAAVGDALGTALAAYPPIVRVSRDGGIVDYLAGQNRPFAADPAKEFRGLKPPRTDP